AEAIAAHLGRMLSTVRSLPADGTAAAHAAALRRALEALELPARARGAAVPTETGDETRALARDQAALRELEALLDELPRAAARVGLGAARLPRARFAGLLDDTLGARRLRAGGVRGAAVELTDLGGVAGRRFAHLFACGLVDGEVPARAVEDSLLGDGDR